MSDDIGSRIGEIINEHHDNYIYELYDHNTKINDLENSYNYHVDRYKKHNDDLDEYEMNHYANKLREAKEDKEEFILRQNNGEVIGRCISELYSFIKKDIQNLMIPKQ